MPTQIEEEQAKEFLKRAEIKTMKKDLSALREVDALKERDKIVKIKTLEEQEEEQRRKIAAQEAARAAQERTAREELLQRGAKEEISAEQDLKQYATEEERQQIFLLESQRFEAEKQIDEIDRKKEPELRLEKNRLLIQKREQQARLNDILEEEGKLEGEQKFITEKEQTSNIPAEKRSFEQTRAEMEKRIEEIEKKRWTAEKQAEEIDAKITRTDDLSEQNNAEKNKLRNKVLGIDKSLREIYSAVMAREDSRIKGLAQEQVVKKETLAKTRAEEKEKIQRKQWTGLGMMEQEEGGFMAGVPTPAKTKLEESAVSEKEQRKKFVQDVEDWAGTEEIPVPRKIK